MNQAFLDEDNHFYFIANAFFLCKSSSATTGSRAKAMALLTVLPLQ
jgi:hypothetical protein